MRWTKSIDELKQSSECEKKNISFFIFPKSSKNKSKQSKIKRMTYVHRKK